ncbi:hypothetical protein Hanom_Chr05g00434751 [Helianthus anomalus]
MPPRMRGRGKAPMAKNDHEDGPSHRRTPSVTMSTSPQENWRTYIEPARHSVSLSSSPSYLNSFRPRSENEPHNSFIPSFAQTLTILSTTQHHTFKAGSTRQTKLMNQWAITR